MSNGRMISHLGYKEVSNEGRGPPGLSFQLSHVCFQKYLSRLLMILITH